MTKRFQPRTSMSRIAATACALLIVALTGCAQGEMSRVEALRGLDSASADVRRKSINELVERPVGTRPPILQRYAEIARSDSDELVRATAIRALNRARDASATPVFIEALDEQSVLIRLEAAKALANLPDERAIPKLARLVAGELEDKDVRIAAADALKHYETVDVARSLIAQLGGRDFGVAWQSRRSLMRMTGADHRYDEAAWLAFIASPDRPFG